MDIRPEFTCKEGNILVLTYWSFSDALIQTYTLPYVRIIRRLIHPDKRILLFTQEKANDGNRSSQRRILKDEGIEWEQITYQPFGWKAFITWAIYGVKLLRLIESQKISFIHCWGTPSGGIGYVLARLTGCKLVLDSYEPHAESMVESGTWSPKGVAFKVLFWLEKKQTQRASYFISATEGMRHYAMSRYGITPRNFFTKPAGVNLEFFHPRQVKRPDVMVSLGLRKDQIICVYAGKFGGIYLGQEVFDFLAAAANFWKDRFRVVLLTNTPAEEILQFCVTSELDPEIVIIRFVPHHQIPGYIGVADFAITPVKPLPSKRYCTPIKNGEYWALGLPVVIPANISDDSNIIESNGIGAVLYELNEGAYLEAIMKIDKLIDKPELRNGIREVARKYRSFAIAEDIYKQIYT